MAIADQCLNAMALGGETGHKVGSGLAVYGIVGVEIMVAHDQRMAGGG